MKPKLKYAPLAIATAIVNVIALIGTTVLQMHQVQVIMQAWRIFQQIH